jgi:hypothetical protein
MPLAHIAQDLNVFFADHMSPGKPDPLEAILQNSRHIMAQRFTDCLLNRQFSHPHTPA